MCIDRLKTHKHVAKHPHSLPEERPHVSSTCSQRRYTYCPNKTQVQCDPLPSLSSHHLVSVLRYVFFYLFASHDLEYSAQISLYKEMTINATLRKKTLLSTKYMYGCQFSFCLKSMSLTLLLLYCELTVVTVMLHFYLWQPKSHFDLCFEKKTKLSRDAPLHGRSASLLRTLGCIQADKDLVS